MKDILIENKSLKNFTEQELNNYRNSYIGFVFQEFNLIDEYDVEKNISLGYNLTYTNNNKSEIANVLKRVDLDGMQKRKPNTLSGGQKQRVAIARALIKKPKILLCDEPTGNLDSETSEKILNLLKEISKTSLVIIITHDKESALKYNDRIISLKDGKIESDTVKEEVLQVTEENVELKKYQLTTKNTLGLVFGFMKTRPIRLFIAMFLSIIAFVLLCISDSIASYNKNQVILETMYKNDNCYISFHKMIHGIDPDDIEFRSNVNMDDSDIDFMKNHLQFDDYNIIYDYYNGADYNFGDLSEINKNYDKTDAEGSCALNQEFIDRYNYELYGNLPTKDDEVVITKYVYEMYKKFGYKNEKSEMSSTKSIKVLPIESMDDLINKTIYLRDNLLRTFESYTIVGILDTKFNYDRYNRILLNKNDDIDSILNMEINQMMEYGLHNVLYFKDNFYQDVIKNHYENGFITGNMYAFSIVASDTEDKNEENKIMQTNLKICANIDDFNMIWKDGPKTTLSSNQIILPLSSIIDSYELEIQLKINEFAIENFDFVKEYFMAPEYYARYICKNKENEYQPKYNYQYFQEEYYRPILETEFYDLFDRFEFSSSFKQVDYQKEIEVVGFYNSFNIYDLNRDVIYVSEEFFTEYKDYLGYENNYYKHIVIPLTKTLNNPIEFGTKIFDRQIFMPHQKQYSDYIMYMLENEVVTSVENVEESLESTVELFKYISLSLMVFVIVFIWYYFSGVIIDRIREIGILRALGASKKDIIKIFMTECVITSLISIIASFTIFITFMGMFNDYLVEKFYLMQSIYQIGIRQITMVIVIELLLFVLGIIIPLFNLMKKKPVDLIYKR